MTQKEFEVRSYPKSELAQLYFPGSTPHVAQNHLNAWIHRCHELHKALQLCNQSPRSKYYSAQSVRYIIEYLGEP